MSSTEVSCFSEALQNFLICVTIHRIKNLQILNAETFVLVSFNNIHKRTLTHQPSDCPYFNEYFVFQRECSLNELLKGSVTIRVLQKTWICKKSSLIGEIIVDLRSVWAAECHAIYGKWGQLERFSPENATVTAGYIQLDLTIVSKFEPSAPFSMNYDEEER